MMKMLTLANYKGGSGKSTTAAGLAAALTQWVMPDSRRVRPVWVWADRYAMTPAAQAALCSVFGPPSARRAPWLEDRGIYCVLRGDLGRFATAAAEAGELDRMVFLVDTGALMVPDAARHFVPRSDVILVPVNRSSAADGSAKLLDTIDHLQRPDGPDGSPDPRAGQKIRVVLTDIPQSRSAREALLRKTDMQDIFSVPQITARLLDNGVPSSPMIADLASPRQPVQIQTLRAAIRLMSPLATEVVSLAGWNLVHAPVESAPDLRTYLRSEVSDIMNRGEENGES